MEICVLIPSYNEANTIGPLIEEVQSQGLKVVVIDDGSTDQTAEIARSKGAEVLTHTRNQGKGASLKKGFQYALNRNYDAVITMDGDNQHSPADLSKFIQKAAEPDSDVIIGNRMSLSKGMPLLRWLTNNLMSFAISLICKQSIPDSQCGFRLIKRGLLEQFNPVSANFEIETETIIIAYRKGFKIKFVPVQTIYAQEKSRINPLVDSIRFFKFLFELKK